jgi:hypothetical protein
MRECRGWVFYSGFPDKVPHILAVYSLPYPAVWWLQTCTDPGGAWEQGLLCGPFNLVNTVILIGKTSLEGKISNAHSNSQKLDYEL